MATEQEVDEALKVVPDKENHPDPHRDEHRLREYPASHLEWSEDAIEA